MLFFWVDYQISLLLYETYANESSQICPILAARTQFDSDHHQHRRWSSHSYSHESVIFLVFVRLIFVKLRRVCVFQFKCMRLHYCSRWKQHCGSVHYITIGDSRLCTVASATGLRDAESIIFNMGCSVASWTFTDRVFHPAQRPVERAPA